MLQDSKYFSSSHHKYKNVAKVKSKEVQQQRKCQSWPLNSLFSGDILE